MATLGAPYTVEPDAFFTGTLAAPNFTKIKAKALSIAYTGVGVYTLTLNQAMAQGNYLAMVTPTAATSPAWKVTDTSATVKVFTFLDNAGAAIELSYFGVGFFFLAG